MFEFKFCNKKGPYYFYDYRFSIIEEKVVSEKFKTYVLIQTYDSRWRPPTCRQWAHPIVNNEIIWRRDDWMCLSPEAKDYISKLVKLKAFL